MTSLAQSSTDNLVDKVIFARFVSERRPDRLLRTLSIFAAELEEKVTTLADVSAIRDVEALRALTHSMLGSGAMLGAMRMVELSRGLQQACHQDQAIDWTIVQELQMTAQKTVSVFRGLETMLDIERFTNEGVAVPA